MGSKIIQVFYGSDCLPYKDVSRSTHFPITGNSFVSSSNVNAFHFYTRDIGGVNVLSWVANVKLPNGKILYQLLPTYHLDEELNEYYVVFDLSSYYTQLTGDIYISLNGCQGQVEITHDDETNIDEISGYIDSRTVVSTGAIKFRINYAPQRQSGYSFTLDQYETIIDGLSGKANIINTIQIVADISQEDLSGYDDGQLFYDRLTQDYYRKYQNSYIVVENCGLLGSKNALIRYGANHDDLIYDLAEIVGYETFFIYKYENDDADYLGKFYQNDNDENFLETLALDGDVIDVTLREGQFDSSTTFENYFNNTGGDNLKRYVVRRNITNIVYGTNGYGGETTINYSQDIDGDYLVQRDEQGQVAVPNTPTDITHATSKKYVDDIDSALRTLIDTIKRNAYTLVDTTEYPTLNDFLASTGEEGYIYLYPSTNASEGYYQYIWESETTPHWINLGTTQIDLSDYYTKSQTNSLLDAKVNKTTNPSKLYGTGNTGNPTTYNVGSNVGSLMVVQRTGTSQIKVPTTPTSTDDATSKGYVDLKYDTLDNAKVSKTSSAEKLYGTDELGAQTTYSVDSDLVGDGEVVRRESGTGTVVVGTPTSNTHATTKAYVDTHIANAISNVYKIKGSKTVAELNALTGQSVGDVYNVTDSGILNAGNIQVFAGDNVVWLGSAWDKLGTEIDWTAYDEKFIAAGFFEVQPYNETTGEITFVYSTELYIMSYDSYTGVMTIEAN